MSCSNQFVLCLCVLHFITTTRPPRGGRQRATIEAVCVECLIGKQNKSTLFQVTDTVTYSQNYDSVKTVKTCEWYELSEKG